MGYIIKSIIIFIINLFFEEDEERNIPCSSTYAPPVETESNIHYTLEQRAKRLNRQLMAQRSISWNEFKNENAVVNQYFINKEVIP